MNEPAQRQWTAQECATIIGGILGTLSQNATTETVLIALRWWLDNKSFLPPSPHDPGAPVRLPTPQVRM